MNYVGFPVILRPACMRHAGVSSPFLQLLNGSVQSRTLWPPLRMRASTGCGSGRCETASFSTWRFLAAPAKRNHAKPKRVVSQRITPAQPPPATTRTTRKPALAQTDKSPGSPSAVKSPSLDGGHHPMPEFNRTKGPGSDHALTWQDYDPEGGMPLPQGELSAKEVNKVFGDEMDHDMGNYAVNVMNWRRQSGSLIDQGTIFPFGRVTDEQALKALEYIRGVQPEFDEEGAGLIWAESEAQRLREDMQERSVRLGIYKRSPGQENEFIEDEVEEDETMKQGTAEGRKRYAESALLQERRRREAEWEEEQAISAQKKEQAQIAAVHAARGPLELSGGVQPGVAITTVEPKEIAAAERLEKSKAWREEYAKRSDPFDKDAKVPDMSLLARLGPSFCLAAATVAFSILLANAYVIPPHSARMFPEWPASYLTIGTITSILGTFFLLCRWPPFYATALKYFAIYPPLPRAFSMIGAMFSHHGAKHLATNLIVLWGIGLTFHEDVGRGTFLAVLLGCGVCGGFSALTYEVLKKNWTFYTMGASSAILGMFAAACTFKPQRTFRILGYDVDFAVWLLLPLSLTIDMVGLFTRYRQSIDFVGHIAGQLSGIGAGLYLRSLQGQPKTSPQGKSKLLN